MQLEHDDGDGRPVQTGVERPLPVERFTTRPRNLVPHGELTLSDEPQQLLAENLSREALVVQNLSTELKIRVGPAGSGPHGSFCIRPDGSLTLSETSCPTGEIWAWTEDDGSAVVLVSEIV